ncbi:SPOR domain-containing protein [Asticcacaulis solisilvae]|uniref:SPOR domain-containing protein n=1 Tax=Asticcacaulis solisilvae TaxID=1217274 RepID=UPI003FD8F6D8
MTDRDRGTYSPPTEDNLSYEARRPAGRDQAPITLIISGIFLVLLLLAVVMFYNSGLNSHGHAAPEVGDAVGDIKDAQVQDAKPMTDQDLNTTQGEDQASAHFAPGTEAPLRDSSASQAAVTNEAPPPAKPITGPLPSQSDNAAITGQASPAATPAPLKPAVQTVTPAASGTTASKAPAAEKPAEKPVAKADTSKADASKSAVAKADTAQKTEKTKTADATTAPTKGGVMVQIGAFDSTETANKQYASVASSYGLFLSGTSKHIEKVETPKGTFYRTAFAGFSSADKAKSFCSALKAAGHDCIVK